MLLFKKIWFQLHWFIGITAGTVLIVIGLSGALLSFQEELLHLLNPATASMPVRPGQPLLTAPQLSEAVRSAGNSQAVQRITVFADPTEAAQIAFAPLPGQGRRLAVRADSVSGAVLPRQQGAAFFDWVERLHRWLLLPRDTGKPLTGALATCLLLLSLSGLYLRWPRRPRAWRTWLTFDTALKGRSFLWGLHAVLGTWALVAYVVFTLTGLYWAFDAVRGPVDRWAGAPPRMAAAPRAADAKAAPAPAPPLDLAPAWGSFSRIATGWQLAQWRLPERAGQPIQVFWLDADAAPDRTRNRLLLQPDGRVVLDERYADLPQGRRFLGAIYPLHMGTYFGLPGRIAMMLASLGLPLFAITGWMLYLGRRRAARALRQERSTLLAGTPAGNAHAGGDALLVAFASQSGRAERLAVRTVAALQVAGAAATLVPMARLGAEQLRHHRRVLLVASTFGEGDPPDSARRFARTLAQTPGAALPHLQYGLLALGDRQYAAFCGFGHALAHHLQRLGAQPLFPPVEMDGESPAAWAQWQAALGTHLRLALAPTDAGVPAGAQGADTVREPWQLTGRQLLNPGSQGAPLFRIELSPPAGAVLAWQPGALVEVQPRHAAEVVDAVLRRHGWNGADPVICATGAATLAAALAASVLPVPGSLPPGRGAQQVVDALQPLAPRRYSIASLPADGTLQLLVRQARHDAGLGLASGWLTLHAPLGTAVALRRVENPGFALAEGDAPAVFIGNGSGYAGLRAHLRARMQAGHTRNWLLFGERQQAHDAFCAQEAAAWQARGLLAHCHFAYSRDQAARVYVQDCLRAEADLLGRWVAEGAVVYVCGSLNGMAAGVDAALSELLGDSALEDLIAEGRYRRDVY